MSFSVQTAVFEGPFDLLLHLILKEQVDLYEIQLAPIIDAYLRAVDELAQFDLDMATEFLLIAATLVELKARRLLPGRDDIDIDDELALWEERDQLLARLLECKTFKDAALTLAQLAQRAAKSYPRTSGLEEQFAGLVPDLLSGVSPNALRTAYLRTTAPKPEVRISFHHVAPIRVSVADAVAELLDELPRVGRISFRRLTADMVERLDIVVRFLAILELFKQGSIDLTQSATFAEIDIVWLGAAGHRDDGAIIGGIDVYDG